MNKPIELLLLGFLFSSFVLADERAPRGKVVANDADPVFPPELVRFVPYEANPVFAGRGRGHWDALLRERGWIMREGDLFRMWYTGYEGQGIRRLGYATSADGLKWKRSSRGPLLDQRWVEDMMVVRHEGRYFMFAEGDRKGHAHLLTSQDGLDWKWQGPLDVRKTDGSEFPRPCGTPFAWVEDGLWYLVYEAHFDAGIWLATSRDLKAWINVQDDPVFERGPELYDRRYVAANQVIRYQGLYYMYYHGLGNGEPWTKWTTNVAVSKDRLHWTKYPGNPLLPVEDNKSSGMLVNDGKGFRLYTMHPAVHVHLPKER